MATPVKDSVAAEPTAARRFFRRKRGTVLIAGTIVLVLFSLVGTFGWHYTHDPVPSYDGTLSFPELSRPVTVAFDSYGTPTFTGYSQHDLDLAQGFWDARTDYYGGFESPYAVATGTIAATGGPGPNNAYLLSDQFMRPFGLGALGDADASSLPPDIAARLADYVAGVNAALRTQPTMLEDNLNGGPTPWTIGKSMTVARLFSLSFSDLEDKIGYSALLAALGATAANEAMPVQPDDAIHPLAGYTYTLPSTFVRASQAPLPIPLALSSASLDSTSGMLAAANVGTQRGGSNAWCTITTHGTILANDPHTFISAAPPVWKSVGRKLLDSAGALIESAAGMSLPSLPGLVFGRVTHYIGRQPSTMAFGLTINPATDNTVYQLKVDGTGYERNGTIEQFATHDEVIKVQGASDVHIKVRKTQDGAIVLGGAWSVSASATIPIPSGTTHVLAVRQAATETLPDGSPRYSYGGVIRLSDVANYDDFAAAINGLPLPTHWLVTNGTDCRYFMAGAAPNQPQAGYRGVLDGSDVNTLWPASDPFLPHSAFPTSAIYATGQHYAMANNDPIGPSQQFPYGMFGAYPAFYRATRIDSQLSALPGDATVEQMRLLQMDTYSAPSVMLARAFARIGLASSDPNVVAAARILETWDGRFDANSAGAAIESYAEAAALYRTVLDGQYKTPINVSIYNMWAEANPNFGDASKQLLVNALADAGVLVFGPALSDAVARLRADQGSDPSHWAWGKAHTLHIAEPGFSDLPVIGGAFQYAPFPTGGDSTTINMGGDAQGWAVGKDQNWAQIWGASARSVIEVANDGTVPHATFILAGGASGHAFDVHRFDQIPLWQVNQQIPMPSDGMTHPAHILVLEP
jgi:acyl-homoserine lactone acylase PvdQ